MRTGSEFRVNPALALGLCALVAISISEGQTPAANASRYQAQLERATKAHDPKGQIAALQSLGDLYRTTGETQKALQSLNRALTIERAIHDEDSEAKTSTTIGGIDNDTGHPQDALKALNGALDTELRLGDRRGEAAARTALGEVYLAIGESQHALELFKQALAIQQREGDTRGESVTQIDIGVYYWGTGASETALNYYRDAIPNARQSGDYSDQGIALHAIGAAYDALNQPRQALDFYQQALKLEKSTGDRRAEAITLHAIGGIYQDLGDQRDSLRYYNQAVPIEQAVGDRKAEATTLTNMASAYQELGMRQTALKVYLRALPIQKAIDDPRGEAYTLHDIGSEYQELGLPQQALAYLEDALPIEEQIGDQDAEAFTRWRIAMIASETSPEGYFAALVLAKKIQDTNLEGKINSSLMIFFEKRGENTTAIFFGKEAVNAYQRIRANIEGLNQQLEKDFVASKGETYRELAHLLIDQGRLPEAQQVLDLLKQQEYKDYVRGESDSDTGSTSLTLSEQEVEDSYQKSTAQVISLGEQWAQLKKNSVRSSQQEQQFKQISDQLNEASKGLNDYYTRLYTLLGENNGANAQVTDVSGNVSQLKETLAKMPFTVALYTVVSSEHYSVIVVTGSTAVAREYAITEKDLNEKVEAFQQVLRNPHSDAQPLAAELYKVLIGPVKADLDQAKAETLIWSLDGALRYVPIAALFDGKQYVVQKYSTVTITPASIPHLLDKPDVSHLSVAAMGISTQYEKDLPALPAVVGELDKIVKDGEVQGANGVLPGTILLNGAFTEKSMEGEMGGQHSVVHIASHFVFEPGDDTESYLLLAGKDNGSGGFHLTVAEFRDNPNLSLEDTALLTLSACETGMSGYAGNGLEVDGLGTMAQKKGSRAVISSLWEVNDTSTGALMADFYKRWVAGAGKVGKVDALRWAQLDLLQGKVMPQSGASGRGLIVIDKRPGQPAPLAVYAHPYYWAPFVLMGNWR